MQFYKLVGEATLNSPYGKGNQISIYYKVYSQMQFYKQVGEATPNLL